VNIPHVKWSSWQNLASLSPKTYLCGYCGTKTGTSHGYYTHPISHTVYICTNCGLPTLLFGDLQIPGADASIQFNNLPDDIDKVYKEITSSIQNLNNTAAVLLSRKLLMHIAVEQGADEGKKFIDYVQFLSSKGFVPPNADKLLDFIRKVGNEKNHEIKLATAIEALKVLKFVESILQFAYELAGEFEDV
jgi:hypothetical protein